VLKDYLDKINHCTRCGFCRIWGWADLETVCPVYKYTPGWETQYARGRVKLAKDLSEGELDLTPQMVEHIYQCTLCGRCEVACPVEMPLHEIFQALRREIAEQGRTVPEHRVMAENIEKVGHPFGARRRHKYADRSKEEGKVNILYYPGCNANYNAPKIIRANKEIFTKLGWDFHIMDEDACCGYPLYESGQIEEMKKAGARNLDIIGQYHPNLILTSCPGCFHALKNIYPHLLGLTQPYPVMDISQFLFSEIKNNVSFSHYDQVVTWHDPCVLGRQLGIYEEPRQLLQSIPGLRLVEMKQHHEKSKCCGASLAEVEKMNELSMQVAIDRIQEAGEAGADVLVTSCPACYINLKRAAGFSQSKVTVKFLSEIVNEVLNHE